MKKSLILLLLVFFTLGGIMNAQHRDGEHKKDKGEMLERMKEKLGLTDQQVSKIKAIDAKYQSQEDALKAKAKTLREEHKALRSKKREEIDQILTAEQKEKVKSMKKNRKKRDMHQHRK
ncbi:Spy/CpxP family protein refolding chaperone [Weeksellaceae bacterium KMM 9713]|uniref:Spy/CpxP family protein refolding chaperone n=1 Tax=Profundicola chukchiensis TaxID=2961959 RepID=A0A9X4MX29_9FLAO|nr:Spy/CpxP family protein refolding chaperone [Profundicola chukchiensis]MDG4945574.1 Spy/CpxP family protein refolding chaperone [Profundicola chukchiensis]MDG4949492.1 Spy/CpxP family protein refolding chaperone [Profundicola chukchiensis]